MTTFSATFPRMSTAKSSKSRKRKKQCQSQDSCCRGEKGESLFHIFDFGGGGGGGSPIGNEYDLLIYGVQQVEGIGHFRVAL